MRVGLPGCTFITVYALITVVVVTSPFSLLEPHHYFGLGPNYVWALPKYIEFASVLASFYSSVSKLCSAISP